MSMKKLLLEWQQYLKEENDDDHREIMIQKLWKDRFFLQLYKDKFFSTILGKDGGGFKAMDIVLGMMYDNFPHTLSILRSDKREEFVKWINHMFDWYHINDHGNDTIQGLLEGTRFLNALNPKQSITPTPSMLYRGLSVKLKEPGTKVVTYTDRKSASSWTPSSKTAQIFSYGEGCIVGIKLEKFNNFKNLLWEIIKDSELAKMYIFSKYIREQEWAYIVSSPVKVDRYKDAEVINENDEDGFIELPQEGESIDLINKKSG